VGNDAYNVGLRKENIYVNIVMKVKEKKIYISGQSSTHGEKKHRRCRPNNF